LQYASLTSSENRDAVFEIPAGTTSEYGLFVNGNSCPKTVESAIKAAIKKGDFIELKKINN
jgi:hypothetical protein